MSNKPQSTLQFFANPKPHSSPRPLSLNKTPPLTSAPSFSLYSVDRVTSTFIPLAIGGAIGYYLVVGLHNMYTGQGKLE